MENKVKILVTGTSKGIGHAIAKEFLRSGHEVVGFDVLDAPLDLKNPYLKYTHYKCNVADPLQYPEINDFNVIVNNAASLDEETILDVKAKGYAEIIEKYAFTPHIKAVVNIASNSAHYGIEFPKYAAANGAVIALTKVTARRLAKYNATCNSISPGYVNTTLDQHVRDYGLEHEILHNCQLKHVIEPEEIAELVYYLAIKNKSMTAQDILVDCGECIGTKFIETPENLKKFYKD